MLSRARALAKVALATLESTNSTCVGGGRWLSAMPATSTTTAVPEGHRNSDLSNWVCHIGLGRRRDLTLRADLALFRDSHKASLADVFRGKKVLMVGFPGGAVCETKHIPGYIQAAEKLLQKGVDKVLCVTVTQPEQLKEFVAKNKFGSNSKVEFAADPDASFVRLLGLELGNNTGPKCQRFAGIVEDGILLKLKVESSPGQLQETDCEAMAKLWDDVYPPAAGAGAAQK